MARKYTGKYPNAVRWIASTNAGGYTIRTNAGAFLRYATPQDMRAAFGTLELSDIAKLRDVSAQLAAQGIATREAVQSKANEEARELLPQRVRNFVRDPGRVAHHGDTKLSAFASDVLALLGVSKLPMHRIAPRLIDGAVVYVISAQEAQDIGEFHRVRIICTCGAHVPAGRTHQHKCTKAPENFCTECFHTWHSHEAPTICPACGNTNIQRGRI